MSFLRDLKIAVRSLARVPALWITVALTLALGIGANAAIFSVVRAVLLSPLANRDEARLLYLRQSAPGIKEENSTFSVPEIDDLNKNLATVSEMGSISAIPFTVVGLGTPREVPAGVVDGHYFEVMGLRPVLGRLLTPADDGPNAPGAIVLTYRFWRNSLKADPAVLGKNVRLESGDGARMATIVGVLEPSVPYPVETEMIGNVVTSPHHLSATMVTGRTHRMTEVFARLAPGSTLDQARAELRTRYAGIVAAHPDVYKTEDHFRIDVTRMHDQINSRANTVLWVLFAASALLFAIACSNVANLVLARTVRREPELAVRSALGASTAVLRRSLLAESLVLCGSGVAAALLLAWPMVQIIGRYAARFSVRAQEIQLDFSLVGFGVALSLVAAIFLAYIPRLPASSGSLAGSLTSTRSTSSSSNRRLRLFAVLQITASFLLLTGAAVLVRTLYTLEQTRPPFDTSHVLAINLPVMNFGRSPAQVRDFYQEVRRRVSALPGVLNVATGFSVPWRDERGLSINFTFAATGAARPHGIEDWRSRFRVVSSNYFGTLGVPVIEGRDFRDSDKEGAERVVIISQALAKELFPNGDALNRELHWTDPVIQFIGLSPEPRRIIGVVADIDDENIIPAPAMTIYQPTDQEGWYGRLLVRTQGDPYALVPAISRTIHEISAEEPVELPSTLEGIRAEALTSDKLNAIVFGGFAAVALLISVVGVAGVLAFSVSGRTREFGIRLALGAQPRDIMSDVLLQGLTIAGIGLVAGVLFGAAGTRGIAVYVADIHMPGVLSFCVSAIVILTAALVASAIPAARAARVNAVEALRSE
ncbi:putative permease [Granulicella aggregans]|uniref:Putative permease n=1 Tax=Granulicella aggregans TaxID=474949 RepID=A0A7W7ZAF2_9BACT|nr:ADOP family duplicated permease [Granulicella aggregans]MBB5056235.1 putative permease [Granulicella aggregans]